MKYLLVVLCLCATVVGAHDGSSPGGVWKFVEDEKTGVVLGSVRSINEHDLEPPVPPFDGYTMTFPYSHSQLRMTSNGDTIWVLDPSVVVIRAGRNITEAEKELKAGLTPDRSVVQPIHRQPMIMNIPYEVHDEKPTTTIKWIDYTLDKGHWEPPYTYDDMIHLVVNNSDWVWDYQYQLGLRSDGVIVWRERKEK